PGEADAGHAPRALAARPPAGLLDEPVLGELAQVPGAVRRALVEAVRQLRGGQGTRDRQVLDDPHPHRMGQRAQLKRILQTSVRGLRWARHASKVLFRKTSCNAYAFL